MNITLSIDERVAEEARKAPGAIGKSLNQAVRDYLEQLARVHQIAAELDITSLPVLAFYRNGQFETFIGGLGTKDEIVRQLGCEPGK